AHSDLGPRMTRRRSCATRKQLVRLEFQLSIISFYHLERCAIEMLGKAPPKQYREPSSHPSTDNKEPSRPYVRGDRARERTLARSALAQRTAPQSGLETKKEASKDC